MSGNLLFIADSADVATLERHIEQQFGTAVCVRTQPELARTVAEDPFGSSILFLKHPPAPARRRAFLELDFESRRWTSFARRCHELADDADAFA